jgi:hypothetical protein
MASMNVILTCPELVEAAEDPWVPPQPAAPAVRRLAAAITATVFVFIRTHSLLVVFAYATSGYW